MNMVPVESSNIKSVGYDPATRLMSVQFSDGGTYDYEGVEPHHHAAFMAAPSKGKHFHQHIRGKFEHAQQ